jgi:GNAT superfamily N-acetyltransferase
MLTYNYEINAGMTSYAYIITFFEKKVAIGSLELTIEYREKNVIHTGHLQVYQEYRGKGYGRKLYKAFSKLYHKEFEGKIISRKFVNPIAEKLAKDALDAGFFPPESWDENYITRDYRIKKAAS